MGKVVVIIGYGSAGQRHARLLNLNKKISKVYILSSRKNIPFNKINKIDEIKIIFMIKVMILSKKIKIKLFLFPISFFILKNLTASRAIVELVIKLTENPEIIFLKKLKKLTFEKYLTITNHLRVVINGIRKKIKQTNIKFSIFTFLITFIKFS